MRLRAVPSRMSLQRFVLSIYYLSPGYYLGTIIMLDALDQLRNIHIHIDRHFPSKKNYPPREHHLMHVPVKSSHAATHAACRVRHQEGALRARV